MSCHYKAAIVFNTLRPRHNERHFADDILKWIFLNENAWISIKISLKFVPQVPINNIPALVQIMAWRRPGDKPLSGLMMVRLPTHICVTQPQWVKFLTINTVQFICKSKMWGGFCEFEFWFIFYLNHCRALYNISLYWTKCQQDLTVYSILIWSCDN